MSILKGQEFQIYMTGLHMNPEEWKRPESFNPHRFDLSSHFSSTPSGKKRIPASFSPFVGGKRICLGKSLAEA